MSCAVAEINPDIADQIVTRQNKVRIEYLINEIQFLIDKKVMALLDTVLHHEKFKALEASWRGLKGLTEIANEPVKGLTFDSLNRIKVLYIEMSWNDLGRHFNAVNDIEQSHLFKLIYGRGFDTPGETPFSVLIGDYKIKNALNYPNGVHDVDCLRDIATIAEMTLCPFISSIHFEVFNLNKPEDITIKSDDLNRLFKNNGYRKWQNLRNSLESRFLGFTFPDILLRQHYKKEKNQHGFDYCENAEDVDRDYLWGNSAYAYAANLMKTFVRTGWFVHLTRGVVDYKSEDDFDSPIDNRLYIHSAFECDGLSIAPRPATRVQLDDMTERQLNQMGIIALHSQHSTYECRFYQSPSFNEPVEYESSHINENARLSAWIPYTLGACRMAHHIKAMVRNKIGSYSNEIELKVLIAKYLNEFTTRDAEGISMLRLKKPLANYAIDIQPIFGEVGQFIGVMRLQLHGHCDQITSAIKLVAKMTVNLQK